MAKNDLQRRYDAEIQRIREKIHDEETMMDIQAYCDKAIQVALDRVLPIKIQQYREQLIADI